eukprot:Em0022g128a
MAASRGLLCRNAFRYLSTVSDSGRVSASLQANLNKIVPAAAPVFQHPHRLLCTKSIDAPLSANAAGTTSIFTRFWRWLNDEVEEKAITQEEKHEREDLLRRVQDMYFAKPPVSPPLEFYREVFHTLIKYEDRIGVETLCRLMEEMKVEPDPELLVMIETFKEKAQRNVWFE